VSQDFVTAGFRTRYRFDDGFQLDGATIRRILMLDLAGIMFSSVMMLFVIVRAVRLDQTQAWFQTIKRKERPAAETTRAWRRQS
jgi:hypothetical protein